MYGERYPSSSNYPHSYYLDSYSYPFRPSTTTTTSNVYFSSHQHPFAASTTQELTGYSHYDPTYFNVAVAAAAYQNTTDPFDLNTSRSTNEQPIENDTIDRRMSSTNKKRKYPDDPLKSQYESEPCRVCDDVSSGYHFGVFTCEACKGFFRRYSKKSTILEPCPIRCGINRNNRNNCAACRFDKCKNVGMALDKIRFGKPPKIFRSSVVNSSVKLEPNNDDFQLMLKLLQCYQSFEESDHQTTTNNNHASIIFQFCHRLAEIVMPENERIPETFFTRLKRHESAIKFLITGENEANVLSWSKEPQAWIFAHNERWRLIMILLMLAFDDEQIGGLTNFDPTNQSSTHDTIIERILRLFELECDQEHQARLFTEGNNLKYMKAQFLLRFVDMMTNDMISHRLDTSNELFPGYFISDEYRNSSNNDMIYLSCEDDMPAQLAEHY